jgi:adenylate kinase family enzyme
MIIGIFGKKGHGKDTIADYLVENYNFHKLSYAEPIKKICKEIFSLSDEQLINHTLKEEIDPRWDKSPRQIMQLIGTDLFRKTFSEDIWVNILGEKAKKLLVEGKNIVISDIRHTNELEHLFTLSNNVLILQVIRDIKDEKEDNHPTEQFYYKEKIPIQKIYNTTLKELYLQIDSKIS